MGGKLAAARINKLQLIVLPLCRCYERDLVGKIESQHDNKSFSFAAVQFVVLEMIFCKLKINAFEVKLRHFK